MNMTQRRRLQDGEGKMAMMLVIIGGAVLVGTFQIAQQFMQGARINAVVQEIQVYKAAVNNFTQTYGALPGDMRNPESKITGCIDAASHALLCQGGDENGVIGENAPDLFHDNQTDKAWPKSETVEFWRQLAAAKMIDGVDAKTPLFPPVLGRTHPLSQIGAGGYEIIYSAGNSGFAQGHYLRLQKSLTGPTLRGPGQNAISVEDAIEIDRKLDDGNPAHGNVLAAGPGCPLPDDKNPKAAASNGHTSDCILLVRLF